MKNYRNLFLILLLFFILLAAVGGSVYYPKLQKSKSTEDVTTATQIKNTETDQTTETQFQRSAGTNLEVSINQVLNGTERCKSTWGDPNTIETGYRILEGGIVCFDYRWVKDADSKTFKILDLYFAKDKNYVFSDEHALKDVDPLTFQLIKAADGKLFTQYAKDKNHVFYLPTASSIYILDGAISDNFKVLWIDTEPGLKCGPMCVSSAPYGTDSKNVYYGEKLIYNANPNDFTIVQAFCSTSNKSVFLKEKLIGDTSTSTAKQLCDKAFESEIF